MLILMIAAAVACLLVGTAVGVRLTRSRRGPPQRVPFGSVADLIEGLTRGLTGGDASRSLERARKALGVATLRFVDEQELDGTDEDGAVPIVSEGVIAGGFVAEGGNREAFQELRGLVRLMQASIEAAELNAARELQTQAQLVALKAQIRPHFIFNALNVIASFTITDPERARALLHEFADFTRYWFREHGPLASLGDELRAIEGYLVLERARYGERLSVRWEISPESLSTLVPHLSLQPLVENAVRHGMESKEGSGSIAISAHDEGALTIVTVEDDGIGMNPQRLADVLAGDLPGVHIGLRNIDIRLRQTYGNGFGLIVDTAPGLGTLITMRIPKFNPVPPTGLADGPVRGRG